MMPAHRWAPLLLLGLAAQASAQCEFDNGTISNPDDPACRDTQLVFTEADNTGNNIALGYPPPVPVESLTAVNGFRTYASLHARHQDLAMTSPTVSGFVVGQTTEGRDVWAYRLGDTDLVTADGRAEAAVIVNGGIHAREWQSPEVLTETLEQLAERAGDANFGQYLADNLNVVLVPVLNIDGLVQTQRFPVHATADRRQPRDGRMRRKNMRGPFGPNVDDDIFATADNFYGIDLNRNSQHGFGHNGGSSINAVSLVYRGTAAGTEAEILALRAATALGPAERLRLGIDLHSFTQIYLPPMTGNVRRDAITAVLATRMRAVTGFKYSYSPGAPGSGGIGTVADYFAYEFQIPAWTLETEPRNGGQDYGGTGASHSGFVMPDTAIARARDELATTLLLGFYRQAGPPRVAAARIDETASGNTVFAAQWSQGTPRTLQVSTDAALVPGNAYRIWIAFDKPMRWYDDSGAPADYPGQSANAQPIVFSSPDAGAGFGFELALDDSVWLADSGGAPDGYRRYRGDALSAAFTVPADVADGLAGATAMSLQLELSDIAQMPLDADPATPADWADGHWTGYEDDGGRDGDTGGADCTLVVFVATDPGAAPPDKTAECPARAAALAPPPPPPPVPQPPPPASSGGGGSLLWLLLPAAALMSRRLR